MKIRLVPNWRSALKMVSVQCGILGATLSTTYVSMYDHLKDNVSPTTMATITGVVFGLSVAGRLIDQGLSAMESLKDGPHE